MQKLQACKYVNATPPAAIVDNTAFAANAVDTSGFDEIGFIVQLGATDVALAALKLTECDTSGGSYTDVSGADFSVLPLTLPTATNDNGLVGVFVNGVNPRKRYLKLAATGGDGAAGAFVSVLAILTKGKQVPATATARGLIAEAIV